MRSKSSAWRCSSRRWRKKTQAIRLSWDASVASRAASANGVSVSATASSATQKPASSVVRRSRRSAGSSGHARASGVEVDGRRIPLQAGHEPGEEVGPEAALREGHAHDLVLPELGRPGCDAAPSTRQPSTVASGGDPCARGRAAFEQLGEALGVAPAITHVSKRAPSSRPSRRGSSSTPPAGAPLAQADRTGRRPPHQHEAPAPTRPATQAAIESEVTSPRRGQLVERKPAGSRTLVVPAADRALRSGAALCAGDQVAQQPAELLHAEDRHPVRGLVASGRSGDRRRARRRRSHAPPGTTSSAMALGRARRAWRTGRGSASSPSPPPTLTTVSTGAPPAARRAPRRGPARRVRRRPLARGARRPRVPGSAPEPTATTGASGGSHARRRRAASSIWRTCSPCRKAAIASISPSSSCSTSEHTSRAMRSRANATVAGRPSGVGQSYASCARWPSTRWTSALIAKYSDATGHQPPRTGTRGAIAARLVRSTPV